MGQVSGLPIKRMQLTKLRAAPVLQAEVPFCSAPVTRTAHRFAADPRCYACRR